MPETHYVTIVDDHTMIRKGLVSLINLFPRYKILFDASDGKDFINQLKPPHLPEIVLLDINMPNMDGYTTAGWIRANYPEIKIIALSTMDAETAIIKMIRQGACGYILKDADTDELKLALDEVMAKGFYYNEQVTKTVMRSINELTRVKSPINAFVNLTDRELEFIRLACSEKTYHEIAREMNVSERTVDGYREAVFKKLNVSTRVGLVLYAIKNNLVKL
jgi:DNA-binding NarL/FixJ family response regulator